MKKSLLALAVLGAYAGVASAQSSVTLSGTLDAGVRYTKNDGRTRFVSAENSGLNSSQLVFSGKEDLGGGLAAGFNLNSQLTESQGNAGLGGKFFNRRSTVSLFGGFGEIRVGRDYTPTFWNRTLFDPFGTVGVGDSTNVLQFGRVVAQTTFVRSDNAVQYFLPSNIGGIYGQFMVAASERALQNPGRVISGRLGFAAGPFDIAAAFTQQRLDLLPSQPQQKTYNIGGSYDLGVVKLMGYFDRDTLSYGAVNAKENRYSLSAVVPLGQGEIHAGYDHSKLDLSGTSSSVKKFALGYVYNLSKRTALYSTVAQLKNDSAATAIGIGGNTGGNAALPPTPGGKSLGLEAGIRHFF